MFLFENRNKKSEGCNYMLDASFHFEATDRAKIVLRVKLGHVGREKTDITARCDLYRLS